MAAGARLNVGIALAGVAIAVSVLAAWISLHSQREVIRAETVRATYDGFRRVSELRITCWQAAHVLETPDNYGRTTALLQTALADTAPAQVAEAIAGGPISSTTCSPTSPTRNPRGLWARTGGTRADYDATYTSRGVFVDDRGPFPQAPS